MKETVYCGYTLYMLLFCFFNQFRPKNAANGILFGEASHPGPVMDNFPFPVNPGNSPGEKETLIKAIFKSPVNWEIKGVYKKMRKAIAHLHKKPWYILNIY